MLVTILASGLMAAMVLMLAFPRTQTGQWLHRTLVEAPARFFFDMTWAKAGMGLLVFLAVIVVVLSPELMLAFGAMGADAAVLEMMIVVWLASVSGGFAAAWRSIARAAGVVGGFVRAVVTGRNRTPRRKRIRSQRKSDDDAEPGWAFA